MEEFFCPPSACLAERRINDINGKTPFVEVGSVYTMLLQMQYGTTQSADIAYGSVCITETVYQRSYIAIAMLA